MIIEHSLEASTIIDAYLVVPNYSTLVWTPTEERERAELANRKHLNGIIFKSAERRKRD
jgi:hypothetical protein